MSPHFSLRHDKVEELESIHHQIILVIVSGAIAAMMFLPGLHTIRKAAQAELKPIIFMAAMILVYSLSWLTSQLCILHLLLIHDEAYHHDFVEWLSPILITMTYLSFNTTLLLFVLKYWGLSIRLDQMIMPGQPQPNATQPRA
jgi:uncharacterized membrane protein